MLSLKKSTKPKERDYKPLLYQQFKFHPIIPMPIKQKWVMSSPFPLRQVKPFKHQ